MPTPLANSAATDDPTRNFGEGRQDPAQRAFDPRPVPRPFIPAEPDTPPAPVDRVPPRVAAGGAAGAWPTEEGSGIPSGIPTVWTGMHGAIPTPEVGARGPDVQPAEEPYRRNKRNAPDRPWDEVAPIPVSPYGTPYG